MPSLLIIAHAPLASSLRTVAAHVYPEVAGKVQCIDVEPESDPGEVEALARTMIADGGGSALVLVDVFGATPSNVAQRLHDAGDVRLVAGVNVPMLWRTLGYLDQPLEALALRAVNGGSDGVLLVALRRPLPPSEGPDAQVPDRNQ